MGMDKLQTAAEAISGSLSEKFSIPEPKATLYSMNACSMLNDRIQLHTMSLYGFFIASMMYEMDKAAGPNFPCIVPESRPTDGNTSVDLAIDHIATVLSDRYEFDDKQARFYASSACSVLKEGLSKEDMIVYGYLIARTMYAIGRHAFPDPCSTEKSPEQGLAARL